MFIASLASVTCRKSHRTLWLPRSTELVFILMKNLSGNSMGVSLDSLRRWPMCTLSSSTYSNDEKGDRENSAGGLKWGSLRSLSTFCPSRESVSINRKRVSCSLSVS